MPGYSAEPTRPDKAKAIAGVAVVYGLVVAAALLMPSDSPLRIGENEPTVLIDVKEMPEPQPPPPEEPGKAELEEGAAGKKAEPTPVVAPKPAIVVPSKPPVVAAPVAGTGSAATAGAATTGTGPGAGGSGTGRGGGGTGGGGGIGAEARLLGGNSSKLPSSLLRAFAADRGYGHLWLTVSDGGRVTDCAVLQTTGDAQVDQALCNLMIRQSRWSPARDRQGNPITVKVRYTATWKKN
jgi:protein TonB